MSHSKRHSPPCGTGLPSQVTEPSAGAGCGAQAEKMLIKERSLKPILRSTLAHRLFPVVTIDNS